MRRRALAWVRRMPCDRYASTLGAASGPRPSVTVGIVGPGLRRPSSRVASRIARRESAEPQAPRSRQGAEPVRDRLREQSPGDGGDGGQAAPVLPAQRNRRAGQLDDPAVGALDQQAGGLVASAGRHGEDPRPHVGDGPAAGLQPAEPGRHRDRQPFVQPVDGRLDPAEVGEPFGVADGDPRHGHGGSTPRSAVPPGEESDANRRDPFCQVRVMGLVSGLPRFAAQIDARSVQAERGEMNPGRALRAPGFRQSFSQISGRRSPPR
jgi:hypothetical protein